MSEATVRVAARGGADAARVAARSGTVSPTLVAAAAERLAVPSAVVNGALRLLDDERTSMRQLAERVGQSPELAAMVLRVGSSAMYGGATGTLDQAVVRIGTESLRALLLAASTYPLVAGSLPAYGLPSMALVRQAHDVAELAQTLAELIDPAAGPHAHVAGLLVDIGMPILSEVAGDVGITLPGPLVGVRQERQAFGTDHVRVGAWICRRWGLAEDLAEAVHRHHDDDPPQTMTARSVWLAGLLVRARDGDVVAAERVGGAAVACGLDEQTLDSLLMGNDPTPPAERPPELTEREFSVLKMLADGMTAKQVALASECSVSTIHNHLHHVYRKLEVSGQAQALLLARERGWV